MTMYQGGGSKYQMDDFEEVVSEEESPARPASPAKPVALAAMPPSGPPTMAMPTELGTAGNETTTSLGDESKVEQIKTLSFSDFSVYEFCVSGFHQKPAFVCVCPYWSLIALQGCWEGFGFL